MDDTTSYSHAKCTACDEENTKTVPDMPMWTVNIKDLEESMMTEQKNKNQELGATQENTYTPEDIEKNKTMAGLAYLLFFLPLIACPESRYAKFHANQALLLLITGYSRQRDTGHYPGNWMDVNANLRNRRFDSGYYGACQRIWGKGKAIASHR